MFGLQPRDELVFGAPNYIINPQSDKILDHLITEDHDFMESNTINFTTTTNDQPLITQTGPQPPQRQTRNRDVYGSSTQVLHRDIERKRRKEMSDHYASLRSLLPLELIQGKRSICDHMTEAANYINDMKKNIQELQGRRDSLRKCRDLPLQGKENGSSDGGGSSLHNLVAVNMSGNGLEILISCTDFGLSKVLAELVEREISVVSCVSTKTKGRFLHKIQTEASDVLKSLDPVELQQRLSHMVD